MTPPATRGGAVSPPLALSMGDPAGIGGELTVAAWRRLREREDGPLFFAIDDPARLQALGAAVREIRAPEEAADRAVFNDALPVLAELLPSGPRPGKPDPTHAAHVVRSLDRGVALALEGRAAGLVTNPINKKALYEGAGFAFPGHTEYLAHLAGARRTVMMLTGGGLRVVPTTIHIPLSEVPAQLTAELLTETIEITCAALRRDFGVPAPRIAVAGLNPHAGEGGAIGREEIETIAPALDALRARGLDIAGPLSADTMFHERARARYDAAVCMYHDQALIPIKTLAFDEGVNVTLGLPFVRTSPDHGTAYDIAGTGRARPDSLLAALDLAAETARRRAAA